VKSEGKTLRIYSLYTSLTRTITRKLVSSSLTETARMKAHIKLLCAPFETSDTKKHGRFTSLFSAPQKTHARAKIRLSFAYRRRKGAGMSGHGV
jgi:hypothetical protein